MKQTLTQPRMNKDELQDISGILLVSKPKGMSSNLILQKVKRLFAAKKAGHTGSLDPDATGMLPICFGQATKLSQYLLDRDKTYTAIGVLGIKTSTGDASGELIEEIKDFKIDKASLEAVLSKFLGASLQVPPMYSALKLAGRPLYRLARAGITVLREPRAIQIYSLNLIDFSPPKFTIRVSCSKGTYIRTLIENIAESLNLVAHVCYLHRDYTAGFKDEKLYSFEELTAASIEERHNFLLPLDLIVSDFPKYFLSPEEEKKLILGQAISTELIINSDLALYNSCKNFIGLGEISSEGKLKIKRLLI